MVMDQQLVKRVKDYFNLNIYETKVWLALISKGMASAGEISELSNVPRSRTYDVLESLEKQGFVIQKIGKPVKYLAVKPEVVLEKLKNNTLQRAKEKVEVLSNMKTTPEYEALQKLHSETITSIKREELSASIKGRSNIFNHLKDVLDSAEEEVIICTDARDLAAKPKVFQSAFETLAKRKVELRLFLRGSEEEIDFVIKKFKIQPIKVVLTGKFYIVDRSQTFFIITHESDEEEIGIWLNTEFFSTVLAQLFDIATKTKKK